MKLKSLLSKLKMAKGVKTTVGLDIGTNSVKVVELRDTPTGTSLVNFGLAEIAREVEKKDALVEAVKKVITESGIRKSRIVSTLSGPGVNIRRFKVPRMPQEELKEGIKWEVKKYLPFSLDSALLDFLVLGEVRDKGVKKIEVLAVAAQKKMVNEHLSLIQGADLKPIAIDALPLALGNILKKSREIKKERAIAVVDIGANNTHINIFKNSTLQFTRNIPTGGNSLTSALTEIPLSYEEAERKKREYGIPEEGEEGIPKDPEKSLRSNGTGKPTGQAKQILVRMRPVLERLLTEIKRSFDYYQEESGGERVDKMLLSGGSSRLKNLREFLAQGLGIRVGIVNPLEGIIYRGPATSRGRLEEIAPQLAVATGLALGKAEGIDLLPLKIKKEREIEFKRALLRLSVTLSVIVLLFFYSLLNVQTMRGRKILAVRKDELAKVQPIITRLHTLKEHKRRLEERKSLLKKLTVGSPTFPGMLKKISNIIPDNILSTELFLNKAKGRFEIKGLVFGDELTPESTLIKFMFALEHSPYFKDISLSFTQKMEGYQEALQFKVTGKFK